MARAWAELLRLVAKAKAVAVRALPQARREDPTSEAFFERAYRAKADPWNFEASEYEQGRYAAILAALGHRRYRLGVEPGCSIGALTYRLASLCDEALATDISETAAAAARERCRALGNVDVRHGGLRDMQVPEGYDLLVLSEVGYYFEASELAQVMARVLRPMAMDGTLLASHWLGSSPDHLLHGDEVHRVLGEADGMQLEHRERHEGFRLDRWVKVRCL